MFIINFCKCWSNTCTTRIYFVFEVDDVEKVVPNITTALGWTLMLLSHRHFFPLALCRHNYGEEHPKYADTLVDYGFYLLNVDAIHLSVEVYKVGELILTWNFVCFSLFVIYFLLFIAPCTKVKKELMSHFYIFGNKHRWSTKCIVDANNFHSI